MPAITQEKTFESHIVNHLVQHGGYEEGHSSDLNKKYLFAAAPLMRFLEATQPKDLEKLRKMHGAKTEHKILSRLSTVIEKNGLLHVLRKGFEETTVKLKLMFPRPGSQKNPEAWARYKANILTVIRQVYYSEKNTNSVDLLLLVNGLPVATVELKTQTSGQTVQDAKAQYLLKRDPRELLFQFNTRALVHFAVDTDAAYLTTHLQKHPQDTYYLPFNLGHHNGAGNPPAKGNYRTHYLWERIWQRDTWLELIGRFCTIEKGESVNGKKGKDKLIFPRYHQQDCVRRLVQDVYERGAGNNYLIQHSAGSGKSNSIAWLSYQLTELHNARDEKIFNTVVVITDRVVLNKQLQDTISSFEHQEGLVVKIDKGSSQLAEAIEAGNSIIITTLQTFPFVLDKIGTLPERNYAVIMDEAHSSGTGETVDTMKMVFAESLKNDPKVIAEDDDDIEDHIRKVIQARGQLKNLSFFGFTATPKQKTLETFGIRDQPDGKPRPFHLYSMRQAIEEGFILDVLQGYTTYQTFWRLNKEIEEDPELNKSKAQKAIARFVSLHEHHIAQQTEVIVEHFRQVVKKELKGQAKAMVVTSSREHAYRYYKQIKKYVEKNGYTDVNALVAFSGILQVDGEEVTEAGLNGFSEKQLRKEFDTNNYNVLVVANKYQTGFDQPKLVAMYVDKKLAGVQAVQTLSRLNRRATGKFKTFVLDFANAAEDIREAFEPYYERTTVDETTDPNRLSDLREQILKHEVIWQSEVNQFASVYYKDTKQLTSDDQAKLNAALDPAVDRYINLEEDQQEQLKGTMVTYVRVYAFLTSILPIGSQLHEKTYSYVRMLLTKLPKRDISEALNLHDEVALEYHRLEKVAEQSISLQKDQEGQLPNANQAGGGRREDELEPLSAILSRVNDRYGTDFDAEDFVAGVERELLQNDTIRHQAKSNSEINFISAIQQAILNTFINHMDGNTAFFSKYIDSESIQKDVNKGIGKRLYQQINRS